VPALVVLMPPVPVVSTAMACHSHYYNMPLICHNMSTVVPSHSHAVDGDEVFVAGREGSSLKVAVGV
jgi:hypothetical protein